METELILPFADGRYRFWLGLPQAKELERTLETPLVVLHAEIAPYMGLDDDGIYHFLGGGGLPVIQAREVIRCGLWGGNNGIVDGNEIEVGPGRAVELVEAYIWPARPLCEAMALAGGILTATIFGIQLKKKEPLNGDGQAEANSSTLASSSPIAASSASTGDEQD